MESSRRDPLNDKAELWSISKNNQNTYHPCFGSTPKTGIAFHKAKFCFYCEKNVYLSPKITGVNNTLFQVSLKKEKGERKLDSNVVGRYFLA